jgi:pyrroline-5-carboxylate reductase
MQITFIGGGNMASALIGGLIKNGWSRESLAVVEIDAEARARVERDFAVRTHAEATAGAAGAECIVLAVKPQQLREIAQALAPVVRNALVISIAAGVRASDLSRWLGGHRRVVRAMPNTPALVLAGMTGLYAAHDVSRDDREGAEEILRAAGRTLWVASEEEIDAVTAISGSGPAYVFYFIEALEQAAADLGFDAEAARALALQTFSGAVKLAAQSTDDVATLRAKVTSKGGTTERAVAQLEHDGVRAAVVRAARAAAGRSRELGDALGADSTTK